MKSIVLLLPFNSRRCYLNRYAFVLETISTCAISTSAIVVPPYTLRHNSLKCEVGVRAACGTSESGCRDPTEDRHSSRAELTTDRVRFVPRGSKERAEQRCGGLHRADGRFIPNSFIRLRRVLGGSPKRAAAPSDPSICHPASVRVCRMCWRSNSLRLDGGAASRESPCASESYSSIRKTGSWEQISARSMTFSSSRTLPGQV